MFGHHFVIYLDNLFIFKYFHLVYQGYFNVLDNELNQWIRGQISERYYPQGFRFTIRYRRKYYIMENKLDSLITRIRDAQKQNNILTQFSQTYFNPLSGSSRYRMNIFSDDLPDPVYILSLYAFDSTIVKRRIRLIQ